MLFQHAADLFKVCARKCNVPSGQFAITDPNMVDLLRCEVGFAAMLYVHLSS